MSSGRVGKAIVLTCFFTAGYGWHRKLVVGFRAAGYGWHRSQCRVKYLEKMEEFYFIVFIQNTKCNFTDKEKLIQTACSYSVSTFAFKNHFKVIQQ